MDRQLDVLVLDHSGVVSNDFPIMVDCVNRTLASFGYAAVSPAFVGKAFAPSAEAFYRKSFPELDAKKCVQRHFEFLLSQPMPRPLPGAVEAVKNLFNAGIILFMCSSHPEQKLAEELVHFDIADYFTAVKGNVDKSRADSLNSLLSLCRTPRRAYVGDTIIDYKFARKAGIPFYAVASEYQGYSFLRRFVEKERIFRSLRDLSDEIVCSF